MLTVVMKRSKHVGWIPAVCRPKVSVFGVVTTAAFLNPPMLALDLHFLPVHGNSSTNNKKKFQTYKKKEKKEEKNSMVLSLDG